MKKPVYLWLALISTFLVAAFLIWAFAQHGTIGLFRVNGTFKIAFITLGIVAVMAPFLAWLASTSRSRGRSGVGRALAVTAVVLALPGLLGSPAAFLVLGGLTQSGIGDTPPQLFLTAHTGAHSLPDVAVTFNTARATKNTLAWGKVLGKDEGKTITEPSTARSHVFVLTDLENDTAYYYRVNSGTTFIFHTAASGLVRFAIGADAHFGSSDTNGEAQQKMLAQIALPENSYDYFFLAGDTAHWGFSKSMWQQAFEELSTATGTVPSRIAAGNHDTMFSGLGNYERYASPAGLPAGTGSKLWTRIDSGNVHFMVLDLEWSAEAFTDEQAAWLEGELRTIPQTEWKVVIMHGFTYASGSVTEGWPWYDNPETIARLEPIFKATGVDLVFSGHDHQMEILEKDDITYVLASPFGGLPDVPRTYTSPHSLWYASGEHGFADVMIEGDSASIVFRSPEGGEIYRFGITRPYTDACCG